MEIIINIIKDYYNSNFLCIQILIVLIILNIYVYIHINWILFIQENNKELLTTSLSLSSKDINISDYKQSIYWLMVSIPLILGFEFIFIIILLLIDLKYFVIIYLKFTEKVKGDFFNISILIFTIYILWYIFVYSKLTFLMFILTIFGFYFISYCILWLKIILIKENNKKISPFYFLILNIN